VTLLPSISMTFCIILWILCWDAPSRNLISDSITDFSSFPALSVHMCLSSDIRVKIMLIMLRCLRDKRSLKTKLHYLDLIDNKLYNNMTHQDVKISDFLMDVVISLWFATAMLYSMLQNKSKTTRNGVRAYVVKNTSITTRNKVWA